MDTQVPVLYLECPLGRYKLQGSMLYPRNRYMVLRLGSSRNVQCEDVFEHIVRFVMFSSLTFSHRACSW